MLLILMIKTEGQHSIKIATSDARIQCDQEAQQYLLQTYAAILTALILACDEKSLVMTNKSGREKKEAKKP